MARDLEQFEPYERVHQHVESLLHGQRPASWPEITVQDAEILRVAGLLNTIGASPRPRAQFAEDLAAELDQISDSRSRWLWRLNRRMLLRGVAGVAGLLVAGAAGARARTSFGQANPGAGWGAVARAAEVPAGSARRFLAGGVEGYLLNVDGAFSAVSALCTHLPCMLDWSPAERQFLCPCHQAAFSADGRQHPSPSYDRLLPPLPTFPVKHVGALIYVYVGKSNDNEPDDDDDEYPHT